MRQVISYKEVDAYIAKHGRPDINANVIFSKMTEEIANVLMDKMRGFYHDGSAEDGVSDWLTSIANSKASVTPDNRTMCVAGALVLESMVAYEDKVTLLRHLGCDETCFFMGDQDYSGGLNETDNSI